MIPDIPIGATKPKTLKEWAGFLGCHVETLKRAIHMGDLKATVRPFTRGGAYEVTPDDMRAYIERRRKSRRKQ